MTSTDAKLLKAAAILWIIWGAVHALAGALILNGDATNGFRSIADGVSPSDLPGPYHAAVGAVLNQHAWNLLWFGVVALIGGIQIWRQNSTAIWVTALVGGLADLGYFMFLDLGGYVLFFPGTLMTLVSGAAILLSGYVYATSRSTRPGQG